MTKQNVGMAREREQSACWWPLTNTRLNTNIEVHNKFGKCSFLGEPIGKSDVMQSFFSMSSTQTKHSRNIHQKMKKKNKTLLHSIPYIHTHTNIKLLLLCTECWALCLGSVQKKKKKKSKKSSKQRCDLTLG